MNPVPELRIDVWSDYVCPFCYLELPSIRRLEARFAGQLNVVWRAFELRPEPNPTLDPNGEYLATTWAQSVYPMAAERGMNLKLPPVQPRSRKALESALFANRHGSFAQMHEALFRAFFEQGRDIGDTDVLCEIAGENGLEPDTLRHALDHHHYTSQVLDDEQLAHTLGVTGVPAMLLRMADMPWQRAVPIRGAVPYDTLEPAISELLAGLAR
jgi:predicted DsbA family dithiol-disulfide isomerase